MFNPLEPNGPKTKTSLVSRETKRQVRELFLVFLIFCLLRLVMLDKGFAFFYIPVVDPILWVVVGWTHELFSYVPRIRHWR